MQVKYRPGVVLCDEAGRVLRVCHICHEPLRMHNLSWVLQVEEKQRVYRLCLNLWCATCRNETILPLKTSFADARQANAYVQKAKQEGMYDTD